MVAQPNVKQSSTLVSDMSPDCPGLLIVLVGPTGAGKNTLMQRAIEALPPLRQMPTMTTRSPREGEQHGREHWFVSTEEFQRLLATNALLEHQEVHPGRFYGVPQQPLDEALTHEREWLIADIDVKGAASLRAAFPDNTLLIFIRPPNKQILETRLRERGQMSEEEIQQRLARVDFELAFAEQCDYQIVNDNLDQTAETLINILRTELRHRGCLPE